MSSRKGRKRKGGLREPNGKPRRAKAAAKAGDVRAVALAQPHRAALPEPLRAMQAAESVVGRAYLLEAISEPEQWAATRYLRLVNSFHRILATPITRQSAAAIGVTASLETPAEADYASGVPESDEDLRERVDTAIADVGRAFAAIADGPLVKREIDAVVLRNEAISHLPRLKAGLHALVKLWRLDSQDAPKRKTHWRGERPGILPSYEGEDA